MSDALAPRVDTEIHALMFDYSSGVTGFICCKTPGSTSAVLLMTNWKVQHLSDRFLNASPPSGFNGLPSLHPFRAI